jgi:hypothetical protein
MMDLLRKVIPDPIKAPIRSMLRGNSGNGPPVVLVQSTMTNVYHCCVQKTASQWLKTILANKRVCQYSGLTPYTYEVPGQPDPRHLNERFLDEPFPARTIGTPLFMGYDSFQALPKPDRYRAFFITRDPRDIVVSWYFSTKYSHGVNPYVAKTRPLLQAIDETEGLKFSISEIERLGIFDALRSWAKAYADPAAKVIRFEDITSENSFAVFRMLFDYCDIKMPDAVLQSLLHDFSFEKLSGRKKGEEDIKNYYRKGVSGDWKNYFSDSIAAVFNETTHDLVEQLGYEPQ